MRFPLAICAAALLSVTHLECTKKIPSLQVLSARILDALPAEQDPRNNLYPEGDDDVFYTPGETLQDKKGAQTKWGQPTVKTIQNSLLRILWQSATQDYVDPANPVHLKEIQQAYGAFKAFCSDLEKEGFAKAPASLKKFYDLNTIVLQKLNKKTDFNLNDWIHAQQTSLINNKFVELQDVQNMGQVQALCEAVISAINHGATSDDLEHMQRAPEILRNMGLDAQEQTRAAQNVYDLSYFAHYNVPGGTSPALIELAQTTLTAYVQTAKTLEASAAEKEVADHSARLASLTSRWNQHKTTPAAPSSQQKQKLFARRTANPENLEKILETLKKLTLGTKEFSETLKNAENMANHRISGFPKAATSST